MSYTPTEWSTGDVITAEKLNNIEQGIVSHDVFVVTSINDDSLNAFVLDKTYAEILTAIKSGNNVLIKLIWGDNNENETYCSILWINESKNTLYLETWDPRTSNQRMLYTAGSVDRYPAYEYE